MGFIPLKILCDEPTGVVIVIAVLPAIIWAGLIGDILSILPIQKS